MSHKKMILITLCVFAYVHTIEAAFDPRTRAIVRAFKTTSSSQGSTTTKKNVAYKSKLIRKEQEKREKMLGTPTTQQMAATLRSTPNRIEVTKTGTQETAFLVDNSGQKLKVLISPAGGQIPKNAFVIGLFYDRNAQSMRAAYLTR